MPVLTKNSGLLKLRTEDITADEDFLSLIAYAAADPLIDDRIDFRQHRQLKITAYCPNDEADGKVNAYVYGLFPDKALGAGGNPSTYVKELLFTVQWTFASSLSENSTADLFIPEGVVFANGVEFGDGDSPALPVGSLAASAPGVAGVETALAAVPDTSVVGNPAWANAYTLLGAHYLVIRTQAVDGDPDTAPTSWNLVYQKLA